MKTRSLRNRSETRIELIKNNNLDSIQKLSMECSKCQDLNLDSTVRRSSEGWTTTAHRWPFTDEQGREHHHKIEVTTRDHWCSLGHYFQTKERYHCWCGWPSNE